jgi:nicotinamidase-related amidase
MSDAQTAADYRSKGFSNNVGFGEKPALLIIDYVTGFTDPACPLGSNYDAEVEATRQLLEAARAAQIPVIYTVVIFTKGMRDAGWFAHKVPSLKHLEEGSPWLDIDPRIAPAEGEHVVVKKYASAFFGTSVASTLTASGCDTLIVSGVTTSGCVRASVVDALQHGFRPIVVRQTVGDRAAGPHEANLFDIQAKYGDVVELGDALAYLVAKRALEPAAR